MLKINDEIATVEEKKLLGVDTYRRMASNCLGEVFGYVFVTFGSITVCAGIGISVYTERESLYGGYSSSIFFPYMKEVLICMAVGAVLTAAGLPLAIVLPKKNRAIVANLSGKSVTLTQNLQNVKLKMANNGLGIVLNF